MQSDRGFQPRLLSSFQDYGLPSFLADLKAGLLQGLMALPVALAVGFGCDLAPEYALGAAIIGGLVISLFGGSRVQIGGPVAAFVVIAAPVLHQSGLPGLATATLMAGLMLLLLGASDLGRWLQIIPHTVIVGLSSGIAVLLIAAQLPIALGFDIPLRAQGLLGSLQTLFSNWQTPSPAAIGVALVTAYAYHWLPRLNVHIPGGVIALVAVTLLNPLLPEPLLTLGDHYDEIQPVFRDTPGLLTGLEDLRALFLPAMSMALLAGLEALHSAAVADARIGGRSHTPTELLAHGIANICSGLLCAMPVSGGIRRTGMNVGLGARTPLAGILQVMVLLPIGLWLAPRLHLIPLAALAGLLIRLALNLGEFRNVRHLLNAEKDDRLVLLTTFLLTVIAGVGIAIQASVVLASLLILARISRASEVRPLWSPGTASAEYYNRPDALSRQDIPADVEVFEVQGAFFFGAAGKFEREIREMSRGMRWLILRMNHVIVLDASGIQVLQRLHEDTRRSNVKLLLAELNTASSESLAQAGALRELLRDHSYPTLTEALQATLNAKPRVIQ